MSKALLQGLEPRSRGTKTLAGAGNSGGDALAALKPKSNFTMHAERGTGHYYWISRVKKNQTDRHWAGSGVVFADRSIVTEYMKHVGCLTLDKSRYKIVDLDNRDIRKQVSEMENMPMRERLQPDAGGSGLEGAADAGAEAGNRGAGPVGRGPKPAPESEAPRT